MSEKQIAYLPCPIISNEIKAQINDLGYIPVDDDFAPDGYQLPPELQSIKQAIDEQNAETLNKAVAFNQALEELADSKRPASKQWVKDYVSEHGGGGSGNPQTFIAIYQSTTAQDIIAFLNNNPHAAVLVKNGDDIYSTIYSKKLAANKVILRTIASLSSKFNIFEYTITDGSWRATTTPLYYDDTAIQSEIAKNAQNIARIADFLGIDLTVEYSPLAENQGVIINDHIGIDTGLTMNGNAIFRFTGCLKDDNHMVSLLGARVGTSTAERTCINALPQSKQIQSQWANNAAQTLNNIEFLQPFEIVADKTQTVITQNGVEVSTIQNGGFNGTNAETPICIFNQQLSNTNYYSPVLQRAEIEIGGIKTVFEPKIKRNIGTAVESVVLLKNGVEMAIDGLTLFEIQAA